MKHRDNAAAGAFISGCGGDRCSWPFDLRDDVAVPPCCARCDIPSPSGRLSTEDPMETGYFFLSEMIQAMIATPVNPTANGNNRTAIPAGAIHHSISSWETIADIATRHHNTVDTTPKTTAICLLVLSDPSTGSVVLSRPMPSHLRPASGAAPNQNNTKPRNRILEPPPCAV